MYKSGFINALPSMAQCFSSAFLTNIGQGGVRYGDKILYRDDEVKTIC